MIGQNVYKVFEPMYYFKMGNNFYRVISRDFLILDKEFPTVNAGTLQTDKYEIDELQPDINEVYVITTGVFNKGIVVHFYQPASVSRYGTKSNPQGDITYELSPAEDPNPVTMMATFRDRLVSVEFANPSPFNITPKLRFLGFKYKIEQVKDQSLLNVLQSKYEDGKLPEILLEY